MVMTKAEKSKKRLISINRLVSKKWEVADSLPRPTSLRVLLGPSLDLRFLFFFLVHSFILKCLSNILIEMTLLEIVFFLDNFPEILFEIMPPTDTYLQPGEQSKMNPFGIIFLFILSSITPD